jgi:hypothetical protein
MSSKVPTLAASHLFQVNPEAERLDTENKEMFHHNIAKLLFLSKHARPDM